MDDHVTHLIQDPKTFWWGHSKEHGWVILDRSIEANKPGRSDDLVFFKCRDGKVFMDKRKMWRGTDRYVDAPKYFSLLNSSEMEHEGTEFRRLKAQSLEFHREILRQYAEIIQKEKEREQEEADAERRQMEIIKIEAVQPPEPNAGNRRTGCWNCTKSLDSDTDVKCKSCGWMICSCGSCSLRCEVQKNSKALDLIDF